MKIKFPMEESFIKGWFDNPVFCKAIKLSRVDANSLAFRNRLYQMVRSGGLVKINAVKKRHEAGYFLALNRGEIYILTNDLH